MLINFENLSEGSSIDLLKKISNSYFRIEKGDWPRNPVISGPDMPVRIFGYSVGRTSSLVGNWRYPQEDGVRRELPLARLENENRCVIPVASIGLVSWRKTYTAFDYPHTMLLNSGEGMMVAAVSQAVTSNSGQFFAIVTIDPKSVGLPEGPGIPLVIPPARFHEYMGSNVKNPYVPRAEDFEGVLLRLTIE